MRKRLFLTGASGCGKSTMLLRALGERAALAGGFRTVRTRGQDGRVQRFSLCSNDGTREQIFLDFSQGARMELGAFRELGAELLREERPFALLDEIGGIELLEPEFSAQLTEFLAGDCPCIGVMKGFAPASMLVERMGLSERYRSRHRALWEALGSDPDTLLLETTGWRDEEACRRIIEWVEEYAHE